MRSIFLAFSIALLACSEPAAPPSAEPIGWQLASVNGTFTYPWYPTGTYAFRADPSDSVDTRYSVHGGYLCTYPDGAWEMIRIIVAEWNTLNPDGIHYPPGGDFHGSGTTRNASGAWLIGTETIHGGNGGTHAFQALRVDSAASLMLVIAAENGAQYRFADGGPIGSQNCTLARNGRRSMRSLIPSR